MKKTLRITFERSVSSATNRPDELEITVTPLNSASAPNSDVTYADLRQTKRIKLANAQNVVTFDLVPTYDPGLTEPIFYRIAWRKGYMGRITEQDFSMPDRDVDFDDLESLGNIITGENYLTEEDLGTPGRVARLDIDGRVLDGQGNPIVPPDLEDLKTRVDQEIRDRAAGDSELDRRFTNRLNAQINSLSDTNRTRFAQEAEARTAAIAAEAGQRAEADEQIRTSITTLNATHGARMTTLEGRVAEAETEIASKADLVGGKVPTSQIPALALNTIVQVADETDMLALTEAEVQPGDIAIRPDGSYFLVELPPSDPDNWVQMASPSATGGVTSVNGQTGAVTLGAADVGARPAGGAIAQADVTGLVSALAGKASTASVTTVSNNLTTTNNNLTALTTRVGTVESSLTALDAAAVKKNDQGEIASALIPADIVRVDAEGTLRRKDGTVIAVSGDGGTGGAVTSVNNKVGAVVLTAEDVQARPTGIPVPIADVELLQSTLDTKASTTSVQQLATRVSRAEVDIDDIQAQLAAGGGTGGTGSSTKTVVSWVADSETDPSLVTMRSPFGIDSDTGEPYYDPEGALEGEAAYPYVSLYGNLVLRRLDPDAPPEPEWGTKAQIDAVSARVTTLESNPQGGYTPPEGGIPLEDLAPALQDAYTDIASATSGASPNTLAMRDAAGTFSVTAPTAAGHAVNRQYVDDGLATKANSSTVTSLTNTVNAKASQSDLTALTGRVSAAENTLTKKADLDVNSMVPLTQIPTLTGTKISGFNLKADLDGIGGKLQLSQVPTGIPQDNIVNLVANLAGKADLVNGKIPNSQLPSLATSETFVVANRAALLVLTAAQVQRGDIGVISDTADKGSYILNGDDPSVWTNWVKLSFGGSGTVESVNGQTGIVTLGAADVGARPLSTPVPQADVSNLTTDLASKASTSYVDGQIATRTTPAQVTSQIQGQAVAKHVVDYVSTTPVASLSGAQSIDGVLVGAGKRVLLTAQAASSQNGIWVTATGAWARPADMVDGSTFMPATVVAVRTSTNPGSQNDTLWQITTTATGTVGTNAQNWAKSLQAGQPKTYTGGNGITVDQAAGTVTAKAGSGIIVDSSGIRVDTATLVRHWSGDVPAGNLVASLAHGLNTRDVSVEVYEVASGNTVLLAPTRVDANTVSVEFASPPGVGQYRAVIVGR